MSATAATDERQSWPPHEEHQGSLTTLRRDENEDRIRVLVRCEHCSREWSGCFAKRLAEHPDAAGNREAWGTPGVWTWSAVEREPPSVPCPAGQWP